MSRTTRIALIATAALAVAAVAGATIADAVAQATRTLKISVNKPGPAVGGDVVTLRVLAADQHGKAIKGAKVVFRWLLEASDTSTTHFTAADGRTASSRTITCSGGDYTAAVRITASWKGQVRRVQVQFPVTGGG
jgi:hypothetical protein